MFSPTWLRRPLGAWVASAAGLAAVWCPQAAGEAPTVKVEGVNGTKAGTVHIDVENPYVAPITIAVSATLTNMRPTTSLARAFVISPRKRETVVSFQQTDPTQPCSYSTQYSFRLGDYRARPDADFGYRLPYESGRLFKVIQGFHGKFSHTGGAEFAVDWDFPEGTSVCAMRAGEVVQTKGDSDEGGLDRARFVWAANFVDVLHSDGTIGHYGHLQYGGLSVAPGQWVEAGTVLGKSGHTGFAGGPHLHFHLMIPNGDGLTYHTVPFKCLTREESGAVELQEGTSYTAR